MVVLPRAAWEQVVERLDHLTCLIERLSESGASRDEKPYYSYQEAAEELGIAYRTVQGYVASGQLLTIDVGGPKIPAAEIERVKRRGVRKT